MPERSPVVPRTFFLNETHEHARSEREGGGPVPGYSTLPWDDKSKRLMASLRSVRDQQFAKAADKLESHTVDFAGTRHGWHLYNRA